MTAALVRLVHPLRPLYRGLLLHPVLLLAALLFLAMAYEFGGFTRDYGVSAVFWHALPLTQFLNGFGVALLLGLLCFVAYLRDIDHDWLEHEAVPPPDSLAQRVMRWVVPDPPGAPAAEELPYWAKLRWYLLATWVPLLVLLLLACPYDRTYHRWAFDRRWPLACGILVAVAWTPISVALFNRLRARLPAGERVSQGLRRRGANDASLERWVTRLFVVLFACYAIVFFLCSYTLINAVGDVPAVGLKDTPLGGKVITGLLLLAIALIVALAAVGVGGSFLHVDTLPPAERWRHTVAGFMFGAGFLLYVATALVSLWPPAESFVMWHLVPPEVGLCLVIALIVIVDNTLRFHFRRAYVPAWIALIGLGVLANSYEDRRLHFPGLSYPREERDVLQPASLDPSVERGADLDHILARMGEEDQRKALLRQGQRLWHQCDRFCRRLRDTGKPYRAQLDRWEPKEADGSEQLKEKFKHLQEVLGNAEKERGLLGEMHRKDQEMLGGWRKAAEAADGSGRPKLVVVATVGGANRAGLWTVVALTGLEAEVKGFPRHVRVIAGASGGMVGASYYVATLDARGDHKQPPWGASPGASLSRGDLLSEVADDHLTPVLHRAIFRDLPRLFDPFPVATDRGVALEDAWDRNMGGALRVPFASLKPGEIDGWRPSLILTPMLVEDGRQLFISNLYLQYMTENGGEYLRPCEDGQPSPAPLVAKVQSRSMVGDPKRTVSSRNAPPDARTAYRYSLSGLEFFQLFPELEGALRLDTAARMNASFPFVSPAVDLPVHPRRRVVDAGYHDNYGVKTAASWIDYHKDWLLKNTSGVLLIQLRDFASDQRRLAPGDAGEDDQWAWSRGVEWLTAPPTAVASARESVMSFRNDEQLDALSYDFNDAENRKEFFTTAVFTFPHESAVNWYLSPETSEQIKGAWPGPDVDDKFKNDAHVKAVREANSLALERLKCWWKVDHSGR
jgi:hypothetical protein